jgi:hypothetical protein
MDFVVFFVRAASAVTSPSHATARQCLLQELEEEKKSCVASSQKESRNLLLESTFTRSVG